MALVVKQVSLFFVLKSEYHLHFSFLFCIFTSSNKGELPSESPFAISEQELKENYEVIFDSIRDISRGFCTMLSEIDSFRFELKPYDTSVMEELYQMKKFSIVDRSLILEIDELDD